MLHSKSPRNFALCDHTSELRFLTQPMKIFFGVSFNNGYQLMRNPFTNNPTTWKIWCDVPSTEKYNFKNMENKERKGKKKLQKHLRNGSNQSKAHLGLAGTPGSQQLHPANTNTTTRFFPMLSPWEGLAPLLSPAMIMRCLLGFYWGSYPCLPLKQLFH